MRLCFLFNSFKALKKTITKKSSLPDCFSHLIKDREAIYLFSLNCSSEAFFFPFQLSLSGMLLSGILDVSTEDLTKANYLCPVAGEPVEYLYH